MHGHWLHTMDDHGLTPLSRAYESGHIALAEIMLQTERDDNSESLKGATPMHRAAWLGLHEALHSLLSYGADPGARDRFGETPLHKAVREGESMAVETLLPVSNVNAQNSFGMAPLHWACLNGRADIAEMLIAQGADPSQRSEALDGLNPAEVATAMGYSELVDTLQRRAVYA